MDLGLCPEIELHNEWQLEVVPGNGRPPLFFTFAQLIALGVRDYTTDLHCVRPTHTTHVSPNALPALIYVKLYSYL